MAAPIMTELYPRFSSEEFRRRYAAICGMMREEGLDCLVLYGNSGVNRHNQANVCYVAHHLDMHHSYVVFPLEGPPTLFIGLRNHLPNAKEISVIEDVRWGGTNPAKEVAQRLKESGCERGMIGLVGVNSRFGIGMPYRHHQTLRQELPQATFKDVTHSFEKIRLIKSEEELTWLKKGAQFTDSAIQALEEQVKPGLKEYELAGIVESAYRPKGGQPHIAYLSSTPMRNPQRCLPWQNPSNRTLEEGDILLTEISASYGAYSGQIHRPIALGEPTPEYQRLYEVAHEAYERIAQALRPGNTLRHVLEAASGIQQAGCTIYDDLIHGYGVDLQPPVIRSLEEADLTQEDFIFEENMAVVIQPNPVTPDERMGLQLGNLTVVTENGAKSLQEYPLRFICVGV